MTQVGSRLTAQLQLTWLPVAVPATFAMEAIFNNSPKREAIMTMSDERTRALLWAGGFLIELARDTSLPIAVRRRAVVIARHFPTIEDVSAMALFRHSSGLGIGLAFPSEVSSWADDCRYGPLRYSTRLAWPEDGNGRNSARHG